MNSKKMVLLTVMVVAVGLFALPNTVQFIEEGGVETPMTEEEILAAWEKLPQEWKEVLLRWDELPQEFGELLSEWEKIPKVWKGFLPAWEKLPAEYKECLLKGEELPSILEELPPEFKEFLTKWEKLPPECKELLLNWDELPPECKKLLMQWEDLPPEWKDPLLEPEEQTQTPGVPDGETEAGEAKGIMAEILVGGAHRNFSCDNCHSSPITETVGSSGKGSNPIECMDCHGDTGNITDHWETQECKNCSICHWMDGSDIGNYTDFVSAGGFGRNATLFDVGGMAGHEDLILAAENDQLIVKGNKSMTGANEACVACHTNATVIFTMPKQKKYMGFDAGMGDVTMKNGK